MSTFDNQPLPTFHAPTAEEPKESSGNRAVDHVRSFVDAVRKTEDVNACARREALDEAQVPEAQIERAQRDLDESARGVETCDLIKKKLDEVEREMGS